MKSKITISVDSGLLQHFYDVARSKHINKSNLLESLITDWLKAVGSPVPIVPAKENVEDTDSEEENNDEVF